MKNTQSYRATRVSKWHHINPWSALCRSLTLAALLASAFLIAAAAIKEGYVSKSATTTTNTAEVFFPQNPMKAIRLVAWDATSDTNNNTALTFLGGTMPITILGMINVTNLLCYSNNLVITNAVALIQRSTTQSSPCPSLAQTK